jgi:MOSC domain-containing protein
VSARISWISLTPVKALALNLVDEIELLEGGLRGDRRFYLVDENNRLVTNKERGQLQLVHAQHDEERGALSLRLADGTAVEGELERGEELTTNFHKRPVPARRMVGPWDDALSEVARVPVRLVEPERGGADRGRSGAATLLGEASLGALADVLHVDSVDGRRFRMNFGVTGIPPHEEDTWIGRRLQVGDAVVVPLGNVGRCVITKQNPDTGETDLDTLNGLADYRGEIETTEPLPFGVHAAVAQAGRVRVGDAIYPL